MPSLHIHSGLDKNKTSTNVDVLFLAPLIRRNSSLLLILTLIKISPYCRLLLSPHENHRFPTGTPYKNPTLVSKKNSDADASLFFGSPDSSELMLVLACFENSKLRLVFRMVLPLPTKPLRIFAGHPNYESYPCEQKK